MLAPPILAQVVQFANAQNIVHIARRVVADIRVAMYRRVLRLSMRPCQSPRGLSMLTSHE